MRGTERQGLKPGSGSRRCRLAELRRGPADGPGSPGRIGSSDGAGLYLSAALGAASGTKETSAHHPHHSDRIALTEGGRTGRIEPHRRHRETRSVGHFGGDLVAHQLATGYERAGAGWTRQCSDHDNDVHCDFLLGGCPTARTRDRLNWEEVKTGEVSVRTLGEGCDTLAGVNSVEGFHPSFDISKLGVVAGHPFEQFTGPWSPTGPVVEIGKSIGPPKMVRTGSLGRLPTLLENS